MKKIKLRVKRFFEKELHVLRGHLSQMGYKALEQVRVAMRAFQEGDKELAAWVRTQDDEIDQLEMEIDAEAICYISLRAPVAKELRMVVMGMNADHEIEGKTFVTVRPRRENDIRFVSMRDPVAYGGGPWQSDFN